MMAHKYIAKGKTAILAILLLTNVALAHAACCTTPIEPQEVAWEHMNEVIYQGVCQCRYGYWVRTGTLVTVWEPVRIIETVKNPRCMMTMGIDEGSEITVNGGASCDTAAQVGAGIFQNVHITLPYYIQQSIQQVDRRCFHSSMGNPIDYMSEYDASWSDDTIAAVMYPETALAATYAMQIACVADSASSQAGFSNPALYWCMGAWGSTYPMSGHVNTDEYITGNIALAARAIYVGGRWGYIFDAGSYYCHAGPMPLWVKSHFMLQPVRPTNRHTLINIGLSSAIWSAGLNTTTLSGCGDNFAWVLWRRRWCCDSRGGQPFNTMYGGGGG